MSVSTLGVLVGQGSFGSVYLAHNNQIVTKVFEQRTDWIIEVERVHRVAEYFYKSFLKKEDWPLPLVREGKIAGHFRTVAPERTRFILETEAVLGGTLKMATMRQPLTARNAVIMAHQLLIAVDVLQSCNLAHLDISANNVMFRGPLQQGRVVLVDLGMSRDLGKKAKMGTKYIRSARCIREKNTDFAPSIYTDFESIVYLVMAAMGVSYDFIVDHKFDFDMLVLEFLDTIGKPNELIGFLFSEMLRYLRVADQDFPERYTKSEPVFKTLTDFMVRAGHVCKPEITSVYEEIRI